MLARIARRVPSQLHRAPCVGGARRPASFLAGVPMGPPDPILGVAEAFNRDSDPRKVNLSIGAYRDANGSPYVLPSVRAAQQRLIEKKLNLEYAPIEGLKDFITQATGFVYGPDSPVLQEKRVAAAQSLSGTGALRLMTAFLNRFLKPGAVVHIPNKTWGNHFAIATDAGLKTATYRYYDPKTVALDFAGLKEDLHTAPDGSVFLLHACAHNPTGVDPTREQWREISSIIKKKNHLPVFDSAYQGFASGDADADAFAVRHFVSEGHTMFLCQSFAKNFGLYGERVGALSVVCGSADEAARVLSQLKILIRPMYSNPPLSGARIVAEILGDPTLRAQWYRECKGMATRIHEMRVLLRTTLEKDLRSPQSWAHITDQIGMFCFTGLNAAQSEAMVKKHHVYMTSDGRISMAGVTAANARYVAEALHDVSSRA